MKRIVFSLVFFPFFLFSQEYHADLIGKEVEGQDGLHVVYSLLTKDTSVVVKEGNRITTMYIKKSIKTIMDTISVSWWKTEFGFPYGTSNNILESYRHPGVNILAYDEERKSYKNVGFLGIQTEETDSLFMTFFNYHPDSKKIKVMKTVSVSKKTYISELIKVGTISFIIFLFLMFFPFEKKINKKKNFFWLTIDLLWIIFTIITGIITVGWFIKYLGNKTLYVVVLLIVSGFIFLFNKIRKTKK